MENLWQRELRLLNFILKLNLVAQKSLGKEQPFYKHFWKVYRTILPVAFEKP